MPASGNHCVRTEKESAFGKLELNTLKPEVLSERREQLAQSTLRRIDLPRKFNAEAYLLEGYEVPGTVLVKPRMLLRSSTVGERVRPREAKTGELVIDLSVALVDGLVPQIHSGGGTRSLPDEFLVKTPSEFLESIEKALKRKPVFLSDVRCPDELKLRVEGVGSFPVSFKTKLKSCPINTLFPAEISLKREDLNGLLFAFASGTKVEVEAKLNLSIPITLEYARFAIKRSKVSEAIRTILAKDKEPYAAERVAEGSRTLLDQIQKSLDLCIPNELFASFLDEIVQEHFRMVVEPDCPNGLGLCFFWKDNVQPVGEYVVHTRRQDYVGRPLLLETVAPVDDYLAFRQNILIRAHPDSPLSRPQVAELNQLFRTIQEGEIAEIRVKQLQFGEISFSEPKIDRISNLVCVQPHALCLEGRWRCTNPNSESYNCRNVCTGGWERRCVQGCGCSGCCAKWEDVCRHWEQICDTRRICDRLVAPATPELPYRTDKGTPTAPDFAWDCTKLENNQCDPDKWEDQWQRITTWSLPSATPRLNPVAWKPEFWGQVLEGVSVKFSSAGEQGTEETVCPLSFLEHRIIGDDRLVLVFRNTAKCSPFNEQNRKPGYGPSLSLLNQVVFPSDFQCGALTEDWKRKRRYICRLPNESEVTLDTTVEEDEQRIKRGEPVGIRKQYYPRVEIQGTLRIVGSYFESRGENK